MGPTVANRTTKIYFRDKKLFVYLNSAPLREELFNGRDKIIKLLNEEAGTEIIEEIIFSYDKIKEYTGLRVNLRGA